jgi:hypothetical protein
MANNLAAWAQVKAMSRWACKRTGTEANDVETGEISGKVTITWDQLPSIPVVVMEGWKSLDFGRHLHVAHCT